MVQAMINISKRANILLNMIKARYDLKTKSDAINKMADLFREDILEPELRPEFIAKIRKAEKEKSIRIKDFGKHFGLD